MKDLGYTLHVLFNDGTEPLSVHCDNLDWSNHNRIAYQAGGWWHLIQWSRISAYRYDLDK